MGVSTPICTSNLIMPGVLASDRNNMTAQEGIVVHHGLLVQMRVLI